jgi:superfamily I DNA/RNA helicase
VLVDEAQDSNGVITALVQNQTTQIAAVGDRCQAIYGWRGATDSMDAFGSKHHVYLTQSWRFGQTIADEANKWLEVLEANLRLSGNPAISSRLESDSHADAVLCRTNAEAVSTVISCHHRHIPVALVGGGKEVISFARGAAELMTRGQTSHPELFAFTTWGEVRDYVGEAHDGAELGVLVKLVDEYSPAGVISAMERCANNEKSAQVVVSTAHKAKGREWDSVRIATDFREPDDGDPDNGESMLAYVATTRARTSLDREGLAWIDQRLKNRKVPA